MTKKATTPKPEQPNPIEAAALRYDVACDAYRIRQAEWSRATLHASQTDTLTAWDEADNAERAMHRCGLTLRDKHAVVTHMATVARNTMADRRHATQAPAQGHKVSNHAAALRGKE